MGIIAITVKASFQLIDNNNILAPIMINSDEAMDTIACDTNSLIESVSAVKLVSSFEGLAFSIKAKLCFDILSASWVRKSRATRSDA